MQWNCRSIMFLVCPSVSQSVHLSVFKFSFCPYTSSQTTVEFDQTLHVVRIQLLWSLKFCGSFAPLTLDFCWLIDCWGLMPELRFLKYVTILDMNYFVVATPQKLLNWISSNFVCSKDTIRSCVYYQKILIPQILWGIPLWT